MSVHVGLALRFWGGFPLDLPEYTDFLFRALIFVVVYQGALYYNDMYMGRLFNTWELCARVCASAAAAVVLLAICYFVYPGALIGRGVFGISIILSTAVVLSARLLFSRFAANGKFAQRILILGSGHRAREVAELIRRQEHRGYKLVGFIGHNDGSTNPEHGEYVSHGKADSVVRSAEDKVRIRGSVTELPVRFVAADYYFDRTELSREGISSEGIGSGKSRRLN